MKTTWLVNLILQPWLLFMFFADDDGGGGGGGDDGGAGDDWLGGLSEELRSDGSMKPYLESKDLGALVTDYIGTKRMMGSRIPIPGQDAGDDAMKEFREKLINVPGVAMIPDAEDADGMAGLWNKLGRPETAEEYGIGKPENLPDGVDWSDDQVGGFLKLGHEIGLTKTQAQRLMDYQVQEATAASEAEAERTTQGKAALQSEWGAALNQNMGIARAFLAETMPPDEAAFYGGLLEANPALAKALHKAGTTALEDTVIRNLEGGGPIKTPGEIQAEIAQITSNPEYINRNSPNRQGLVDKVGKLYQQLEGLKKAG